MQKLGILGVGEQPQYRLHFSATQAEPPRESVVSNRPILMHTFPQSGEVAIVHLGLTWNLSVGRLDTLNAASVIAALPLLVFMVRSLFVSAV